MDSGSGTHAVSTLFGQLRTRLCDSIYRIDTFVQIVHVASSTAVEQLQPRASHLARRIQVMTHVRTARSLVWIASLVCGTAVTASVALALPTLGQSPDSIAVIRTSKTPQDERALVHLTEVGLIDVPEHFEIVIFSTGQFRVGIGIDAPMERADTVRMDHLPAMTADVTDGDVHIQLIGPGRISVGGKVTGGAALRLSATGKHIILMKGGVGIREAP